MNDPMNLYTIDALRVATGLEIEPAVATARQLSKALDEAYQSFEESPHEMEAAAGQDPGPVAQLVNSILERAVRERASDLHLEPQVGGQLRIRMRVDGFLRDAGTQSPELQAPLISRLKVMANWILLKRECPKTAGSFCRWTATKSTSASPPSLP